MTARSNAYWTGKLIPGYEITDTDWVDLQDTYVEYKPTSQPAIAASLLTLDAVSARNAIFEPTPRPITSNFTIAFAGMTNVNIVHVTLVLTGTMVVTMPSNVDVSDALPSFASWDAGTDELTLTMGTAEKIELSFMQDNTDNQITLVVGGIAI